VNAAEPDDEELDGIWAVTDIDDMLSGACDEVLGFYKATSLIEEPPVTMKSRMVSATEDQVIVDAAVANAVVATVEHFDPAADTH